MKKTCLSLILVLASQNTLAALSQQDTQDNTTLDYSFNRSDLGLVSNDENIFYTVSGRRASVHDIIAKQSAVQTQGGQSACSIFSTTGLIESRLMELGAKKPLNLSEMWMIYLTAGQAGAYGVSASNVVATYGKYGFAEEKLWKLNTTPWKEEDLQKNSPFSQSPAKRVCGHLVNTPLLLSCLIGQEDPRLLTQSREDLDNKKSNFYNPAFLNIRDYSLESLKYYQISGRRLHSKSDIINLLDSGEALLMDVNVYFEAWNHSRSQKMGLERDESLFKKGIISYPPKNSLDYKVSKNVAGHSVIIVGYDLNQVIERQVKDVNGKYINAKTKGVYYIKNSWGTSGFGSKFQIDGKSYPGYGMIPMDYAHEEGRFVRLSVKTR